MSLIMSCNKITQFTELLIQEDSVDLVAQVFKCRHQFSMSLSIQLNLGSARYGSGCSCNVYGFAWRSVEMVLRLVIDMSSLIVLLGLVDDMCLFIRLTRFGFDMGVIHCRVSSSGLSS